MTRSLINQVLSDKFWILGFLSQVWEWLQELDNFEEPFWFALIGTRVMT